ncbi:MAG: hypothetical protein LBI33_08075 [Propionibacteriaceae bacterium]|jgi:hypothetical protein|nr:hypothetical protein [Propionibacteriaceae bacterium]
MTRNGRFPETEALILASVQAVLPDGWQARISGDETDITLEIISGTGLTAMFAVLATGVTPAQIARVTKVAEIRSAPDRGRAGLLVWSKYLSAPAREQLARAGISYADATGWARIVADDPMLAITAQGAAKAPKPDRGSTTISRLDGRAAGRIVRSLFDGSLPVGVRGLAAQAHVSPGTVSKTLPTLAADSTIDRDEAGRVRSVDRRQLLDRWTTDYHVLDSNGTPGWFVAPRGLDNTLAVLTRAPRAVVSGTRAAQAWLPQGIAPLIPTTQLLVYTDDPSVLARLLGVAAVEPSAANVVILAPQDLTILDNPESRDGIPVAPLPLVLADLLTLPGRYPQQAEALMDALAKTDPQWRP